VSLPSLLKNNLLLLLSFYKHSNGLLFCFCRYFSQFHLSQLFLTLDSQYNRSVCRLEHIISRLVTSNLYLDFSLIYIDSDSVFLYL